MTADFQSDLANERNDTRRPELRALLKAAFPDATAMKIIGDLGIQKMGVDAVIRRPNGDVKIDFKFRGENRDYDDFCLEYSHDHDDGRVTLGWVEDQSKICDFFAYVRKKNWVLSLLPRERLQLAWAANKSKWITDFVSKRTRNKTYWTNWCAVPRTTLLAFMEIVEVVPPITEKPNKIAQSTWDAFVWLKRYHPERLADWLASHPELS